MMMESTMSFHILDILTITIVLLATILMLSKMAVKVYKSKGCATLCNGCSSQKCSVKNFAKRTSGRKQFIIKNITTN